MDVADALQQFIGGGRGFVVQVVDGVVLTGDVARFGTQALVALDDDEFGVPAPGWVPYPVVDVVRGGVCLDL